VRRFLRACLGSAALAALPLACKTPVAGAGEAECPVCKHEGDLACLCVPIEGDTPRCERDGVTWYFCSQECRAAFERAPELYLPR